MEDSSVLRPYHAFWPSGNSGEGSSGGPRPRHAAPTGILLRMQIHVPDPAYTGSALARANFRLAVKISFGFVGLLWLIALLGWGLELEQFGVRPREWVGL